VAIAKADTTYRVDELQRKFAYDRVLARCFTGEDKDRWILKGAGALLRGWPLLLGTAKTSTCTATRIRRPRTTPWTRFDQR